MVLVPEFLFFDREITELSKANKILKVLEEQSYIKKISRGSNYTGRANTYVMLNLQPNYISGVEVELKEAERNM